jgi:hypothetical protein
MSKSTGFFPEHRPSFETARDIWLVSRLAVVAGMFMTIAATSLLLA